MVVPHADTGRFPISSTYLRYMWAIKPSSYGRLKAGMNVMVSDHPTRNGEVCIILAINDHSMWYLKNEGLAEDMPLTSLSIRLFVDLDCNSHAGNAVGISCLARQIVPLETAIEIAHDRMHAATQMANDDARNSYQEPAGPEEGELEHMEFCRAMMNGEYD